MNTTKTIILMVGLTVLLVFVGGALGGRQGVIIAFMFAMVMNMFSYWFSDKIVLRMYNAQEVTDAEGLRHPIRCSERICHGTQPKSRGRCRYRGNFAPADKGRARRRHGP